MGILFSESKFSNSSRGIPDNSAALPIVSFCNLYNRIAKLIFICFFNSFSLSFNANKISSGISMEIVFVFS